MSRPFKLTPAEIDEVWARWRSGQAVKVLSRQMRVNPSTVRDLLRRTGGIRPAPRRRWELRLSLAEREEISRGLAAGSSLRVIATGLGRAPSTVSREVLGNGGRSRYRAAVADQAAWSRAARPQATKLASRAALADLVAAKLELNWSPQQIAGWLKVEFPDDGQMQVSHESIHRSLFVQTRGSLRKELTTHLRPAEVEDRAVPGHWEGDLILGSTASGSAVGTLVERTTRFVLLLHLPGGHTADIVQDAMIAKMATLPEHLRRSLTWDQGKEMANHVKIAAATGLDIYFCDPHSPWQRGSNENAYWYKMAGPERLRREPLRCGQPGDSENTCRQAFR